MNEQEVREIAAAAFKARFRDIDIICVNVKHGFDHCDDPALDVTIIYDGEFEQLNGEGILGLQSELIEKVWEEVEDSPVWPYIHMIAKSDIGEEEDPATVYG